MFVLFAAAILSSPLPSPSLVPSPIASSKPSPQASSSPKPVGKLPAIATRDFPVIAANLRVNQDFKGIALATELIPNPQGSARLTNVSVSNGSLFWGHGGNKIELYNSWTEGQSWKYRVCNFNKPLKQFIWDNSAIDKWIVQGGRVVKDSKGNSVVDGEAAVRLMQIDDAQITGVKIRGWKYDGKHYWKQAVQDRSGGNHYWRNVYVEGIVDIGYMTDPNIPIQPLNLSYWENCTITGGYHRTPGVKRIVFKNCIIQGKLVNMDKTYP